MEFVSVILYIGLSMYLLYCAFLGNYKLGLRFYLPTFYPITKNETFMGGMLFSCWLGMIWCFTLLQFLTQNLETYMLYTDVNMMFNINSRYLWFF